MTNQKEKEKLARIVVTREFVGICHMQVCAIKDATDEEILKVCNEENPSGTTGGWGIVCRAENTEIPNQFPVQCSKYPERQHLLIVC